MGLKSTADRYGTMIVSIHWVSALLIIILLVSGFRAASTLDPVAKAAILKFHLPLAIAVLALIISRLVWWWRFDRKPKPIAGSSYWQERLARGCIFSSTSSSWV